MQSNQCLYPAYRRRLKTSTYNRVTDLNHREKKLRIISDTATHSVMKSKLSKEADQYHRKPFVNELILTKTCSSAPCNFPKEKGSIMSFLLRILLNFSEQLFYRITVNSALFKVNNGNTRTISEICLKMLIKTREWHQWRLAVVFIVNFEQISHIVLVFATP